MLARSPGAPQRPGSLTRRRARRAAAADAPRPGHQDGAGRVWLYPSEQMFFNAMQRKGWRPSEGDMRTVVSIHNAVNERAWSLIRSWETTSPRLRAANASCGGPRLRSFRGDSKALTPRARVYGWLGYERPFDRHDWVVERCGREGGEVEYVIDFYRGRGSGGEGAGLSFYLDVRPKLNSWEGVRMRVGRLFGFY